MMTKRSFFGLIAVAALLPMLGRAAEMPKPVDDPAAVKIALGVDGIVIQHGLPETMTDAARRAVAAGIEVVAFDDPIATSVAKRARAALSAHPEITAMFAPYDEFARGVRIAVDEAALSNKVSIYSADISTADIHAMRAPGSPWKATAATNPALVGEVSVRALAMLLAGQGPGHNITVPPTLITQKMLRDLTIEDMAALAKKVPAFAHVDIAVPAWMPLPAL